MAPVELQCDGLQLMQRWEVQLTFIPMNHAVVSSLQLGADTEET